MKYLFVLLKPVVILVLAEIHFLDEISLDGTGFLDALLFT